MLRWKDTKGGTMPKVSLPVLYDQMDSRWAKQLLGFNTGSTFNFYNFACLISTLAEVSRYYGHDETPVTINEKLRNLGSGQGFQAGSGNYVWGGITKIFSDIKEIKTECPGKLTDAQIGEIKSALDKGFPVMVQIDVNPKTVANDTHYSALVDYDPNDENNFTLADTLGGQTVSLKKYLGWLRPSARESIYKYVIYEGVVPEKGVLVPVNIYPQIIHNSTQWDKTVAEYIPSADPKSTQFEDVRAVVGGIKSRATTQENRANEAEKNLAVANVEIENQKQKVANVRVECQNTIDSLSRDISSLSIQVKDLESVRGQLLAAQTQLRDAQKEVGKKDLVIAGLQSDLDVCQKSQNAPVQVVVQPVDSLTVQELIAKLIEKILAKKTV